MNDQPPSPSFEQLVDWLEGRLSDEQARLVSEQVAAAGPAVRDDLAWLQRFYRAGNERVVADPPPAVIERLQERFAAYARARRQPSLRQRHVAILTFDSWLSAARGIRSAISAQDQRQLVYESESASVALTLQRRAGEEQLDLLGQILPAQIDDVELVHVALLREQGEFDAITTDSLGEFTLTAIPADRYTLLLTSDQFEIKIGPLDLSL